MAQIFTRRFWLRLLRRTSVIGVAATAAAWLGGGTPALEVTLSVFAGILALEFVGWTLARTFPSGDDGA